MARLIQLTSEFGTHTVKSAKAIGCSDIKRNGNNCIEINRISFGCAFVMCGCKQNYPLHNCMLVQPESGQIYIGDVSIRFDGNICCSILVDADSLKEAMTGLPPTEADYEHLMWCGFIQPHVKVDA